MEKIIEVTIMPTKINKSWYDIIKENDKTYQAKNYLFTRRVLKSEVYKKGFYKLEHTNTIFSIWVLEKDLKQFNQLCVFYYQDKLKFIKSLINDIKKE